jgi:tripartite-type tricarboxylate transporter receptor subunit TctC
MDAIQPVRLLVASWIAIFSVCFALPGMAPAAGTWTPDRPLRMLVPFPPGGTADLMARVIATPLGNALGEQIVVDNRGGAGGIIAMDTLAHALPNGYTIGIASLSAHAGNATLNTKLPYDSIKDFAPITFGGQSPLVLAVHPSNPAQSVKDMIARARAASRPINFATSGIGIANHIAGELLKLSAAQEKVQMVHVPFKGGGPAMIAVMGGQVEMQFNPLSSVLPFVQGGKLRALAIADQKRSALLPGVATMAESGYPGFYMIESFGLLAPAGTPVEIVRRLNAETVKALKEPELVQRMTVLGVELVPSTPQQLGVFIESEIRKYRDIIQRAGITAD